MKFKEKKNKEDKISSTPHCTEKDEDLLCW